MGRCIFRNNVEISDYGQPYIVAEINSSHGGSLDRAKQMIDVAADIGCDCVKFQSWSADSLYSKTYYDTIPFSKRFVSKFSFSAEKLKELAGYCKEKKIDFSSTPYCEEEVDFLTNDVCTPYVKIASMEINNIGLLDYIGRKKVPIVLSTGMSDINEIERAVKVLEDAGVEQMVILHCVSIYPTILSKVNLNNIIGLREKFPGYPIGFSDHTEGDAASIAAIALGAGLIEKHLTLDKTKAGMDNGMATEPQQFRELVTKCREIQIAMGGKNRIVIKEEMEQRKNMRRSIIAVRNLKAGTVISEKDLYAKRPGTGISPDRIQEVIGKTVIKDIEEDSIIPEESILWAE